MKQLAIRSSTPTLFMTLWSLFKTMPIADSSNVLSLIWEQANQSVGISQTRREHCEKVSMLFKLACLGWLVVFGA